MMMTKIKVYTEDEAIELICRVEQEYELDEDSNIFLRLLDNTDHISNQPRFKFCIEVTCDFEYDEDFELYNDIVHYIKYERMDITELMLNNIINEENEKKYFVGNNLQVWDYSK